MTTVEVTDDDMRELRGMTTAHVRRNYRLCRAQLDNIRLQGNPRRLDEAASDLSVWQGAYLDELVRRGERV